MKFLTPASGLQGYWDPYPIDMEFRPPCMVLSTIGISKPGKLEGQSTRECSTHLHQLHVCLPSTRQKTRLLYRMSLDFAPVLKQIPFMHYLWRHFAEQVKLSSHNGKTKPNVRPGPSFESSFKSKTKPGIYLTSFNAIHDRIIPFLSNFKGFLCAIHAGVE